MTVVVTRPSAGYTSTTTTTNATKYQTDSSLMSAISSVKVDGDINKLVDGINTVASYDGGYGTSDLSTALIAIKAAIDTNSDDIANLTAGTIPDGDYGDITVSSSGTVWSLNSGVVNTTELATNAVTNAKMADNAIDTAELVDGAVTSDKLGTSSVTASKLPTGVITNVKIASNTIQLDKMADISNYTVIGNVSGGATIPSEVTILDEDDMVSNSATALATQQSIKAYADSVIPAEATTTSSGIIEIATDAETIAKTATNKAIVPSNLGAVFFKSAGLAYSGAGSQIVSAAHGLGAVPTNINAYLVCTIADNSFSVGDVIKILNSDIMEGVGYYQLYADSTNVYAGRSNQYFCGVKGTPSAAFATFGRWQLILTASLI